MIVHKNVKPKVLYATQKNSLHVPENEIFILQRKFNIVAMIGQTFYLKKCTFYEDEFSWRQVKQSPNETKWPDILNMSLDISLFVQIWKLCMYVCMYACMYVCINLCVWLCVCECVCECDHVRSDLHAIVWFCECASWLTTICVCI